jgi:hypothetical protein
MTYLVKTFGTESAAWLASARIAANGGPASEVRPLPLGFGQEGFGVYVQTSSDIHSAKAILDLF